MPELIGIGVGPGDPDLLTVKAVKAIQNADTIMCPASNEDRPSIALSVVAPLIDKSKNQEIIKLIFPMTKDKDVLEKLWVIRIYTVLGFTCIEKLKQIIQK